MAVWLLSATIWLWVRALPCHIIQIMTISMYRVRALRRAVAHS